MARSTAYTKEDRCQFTLSPNTRRHLEVIREATDAASLSEVVRSAVRLYAVLLQRRQLGETLFVRGRDGVEREVLLV